MITNDPKRQVDPEMSCKEVQDEIEFENVREEQPNEIEKKVEPNEIEIKPVKKSAPNHQNAVSTNDNRKESHERSLIHPQIKL